MEKITKTFEYCYENDTTIEYVNTGLYSMLNCSYTSEDPDYGTDTIHYGVGSKSVRSMKQMATDMLREVKDFLDYRDGVIESSLVCDIDYDDYSSSTLIAIEYALNSIIEEETKMEANHYAIGAKVRVDYDITNLQNVDTGNLFRVAKGQIGTIMKINPRDSYIPDSAAMYLVRFDNIPDPMTGEIATGWVPETDISMYASKKWYMSVKEASELIIGMWRDDPKKVFSFCESDRYEAMGDPLKHVDNGGWYGVQRVNPFDGDSCEFSALVGYWGGGTLELAYVGEWEADDSNCETALRQTICKATGWDADNYIYIEEEEEK